MSLALAVRDLIEEAAEREKFAKVKCVRAEIGALSGVEREAFAFCFDLAMKDSVADGARLEIVATAGGGRCPACGRETPLTMIYDACAHCGAFPVEVTAGKDMRILELEVE
ncbi:MAG: hydrogenase maturation nickel metallochaperone HypA [Rhodocyclaceae bacterium]|nr:hydrogenase maturation nickel metallochaperone HypA [Rhodocyclaceae bacterium]